MAAREAKAGFPCFGSTCAVFVTGDAPDATAQEAVERTKAQLLEWHDRFTRFSPGSELSRLNADPRGRVPVSPVMARFAEAVVDSARETGGLVDATLLGELELAGYRQDLGEPAAPLADALRRAPERRPGGPRPSSCWWTIEVDHAHGAVQRPPGVRLDSGGLAKGLFADLLAERLAAHATFAIDCAGDLRLGGAECKPRAVDVRSPFGEDILHRFELAAAGVATSGIGRRSWSGADGRPAHHLLDPATGRPAFTGVVQVTALAPTALAAEMRAKAALLSGPDRAREWLPDGGVIVLDDGSYEVVASR